MPPSPAQTPAAGRSRVLRIVGAVLLLAVPLCVAFGLAWLGFGNASSSKGPAPNWIALEPVRASTGDGSVVRTRVAVDADDSGTRRAIQQRAEQVGVLLGLSVSSLSREQIAQPQGITALADDMRKRLNAYLAADGLAPVRAVVIQDLVVNPQ